MELSRTAGPVGLIIIAGCATLTMPEARLRNEVLLDVYWGAARECERRYSTLHVESMSAEGDLSLRADADSRSEAAPFRECYRHGVATRLERRRAAGLPVPEHPNTDPTVDIN
jgi:hypothetical protein